MLFCKMIFRSELTLIESRFNTVDVENDNKFEFAVDKVAMTMTRTDTSLRSEFFQPEVLCCFQSMIIR